MNNKQKLLTATAITGTIVSASAFTVFDYAICRRKKQPDVRKKEKWKPYLDYVLKEQEWLKEHQEQELKEIRSKDGLTLRAVYIPRENAKGTIICMHGYHSTNDIEFVPWQHLDMQHMDAESAINTECSNRRSKTDIR